MISYPLLWHVRCTLQFPLALNGTALPTIICHPSFFLLRLLLSIPHCRLVGRGEWHRGKFENMLWVPGFYVHHPKFVQFEIDRGGQDKSSIYLHVYLAMSCSHCAPIIILFRASYVFFHIRLKDVEKEKSRKSIHSTRLSTHASLCSSNLVLLHPTYTHPPPTHDASFLIAFATHRCKRAGIKDADPQPDCTCGYSMNALRSVAAPTAASTTKGCNPRAFLWCVR